MSRFALLCASALVFATPALAQDVSGTWLRDTGVTQVRFVPCGNAMCGNISWLKPGIDAPAKVGQRIFSNMKPDGPNSWTGTAFNPEDGKTYAGKMTLSGDTLTTAGCVAGGMICRSSTWTKVK